jgi:hypothetical protein
MTNGSTLAKLAYLKDEVWTPFGHLIYFRSHDVRIRLTTLPLWAIVNDKWTLGTFCEQFKVEDAPYLSGDIIVKDCETKEIIKIGRLETYQDPTGKVVHYMVKLNALPAGKLVAALRHAEPEKKKVWLDVQLDDKE